MASKLLMDENLENLNETPAEQSQPAGESDSNSVSESPDSGPAGNVDSGPAGNIEGQLQPHETAGVEQAQAPNPFADPAPAGSEAGFQDAGGAAPQVTYNPGEAIVNPEQVCLNPPIEAPDISADLEAIAAGGGAVAATVLGLLTVGGSFVTNWSIINGIMGIVLGLWGLSSRRRRLAWIGLSLCLIGSVLSIISINDFIQQWFLLQQDPV